MICFFSNDTTSMMKSRMKMTVHPRIKNEVFQDAGEENPPNVDAKESEDGKEGECPECGDRVPIYNYCVSCKNSGMIYDEIPSTEDIPSTSFNDEREGNQEGTCPECNWIGRAGDSCSHCQDSILLNFQARL
jgi:hypothetical protein